MFVCVCYLKLYSCAAIGCVSAFFIRLCVSSAIVFIYCEKGCIVLMNVNSVFFRGGLGWFGAWGAEVRWRVVNLSVGFV